MAENLWKYIINNWSYVTVLCNNCSLSNFSINIFIDAEPKAGPLLSIWTRRNPIFTSFTITTFVEGIYVSELFRQRGVALQSGHFPFTSSQWEKGAQKFYNSTGNRRYSWSFPYDDLINLVVAPPCFLNLNLVHFNTLACPKVTSSLSS